MNGNAARKHRTALNLELLEARLVLDGGGSAVLPPFPGKDHFVATIDNPFSPLIPGTTFIYEGSTDRQPARDVFAVTHDTKKILGVTTTVIRDQGFVNGQLAEETFDWFAQDDAGNVWYFGEDSREIQNGVVVSTEGSWEAGVNGAQPGIIMEAHPSKGDSYQQEFAPGVAQDQATVLNLNANVTVPFGSFHNCLETEESSPLDPGVIEHKFYAQGVGFLRSVIVKGGKETLELVSISSDNTSSATTANAVSRMHDGPSSSVLHSPFAHVPGNDERVVHTVSAGTPAAAHTSSDLLVAAAHDRAFMINSGGEDGFDLFAKHEQKSLWQVG